MKSACVGVLSIIE